MSYLHDVSKRRWKFQGFQGLSTAQHDLRTKIMLRDTKIRKRILAVCASLSLSRSWIWIVKHVSLIYDKVHDARNHFWLPFLCSFFLSILNNLSHIFHQHTHCPLESLFLIMIIVVYFFLEESRESRSRYSWWRKVRIMIVTFKSWMQETRRLCLCIFVCKDNHLITSAVLDGNSLSSVIIISNLHLRFFS